MPFGEINNVVPLFLQGRGTTNEMPLNVATSNGDSGVTTLFTQGPEANNLTLWIGKEIDASGTFPLYIQSPWATGSPGSVLNQGFVSLAVSGNIYYGANENNTLSIAGPPTGSSIAVSTLFVRVDDGTVPSGQISVFMEGNNPGGVGVGHNEQTTLFIRVQEVQSSGMPIYLERPIADSVPLSIRSDIASGTLPVSVSGTLNGTGSMTLHVVPPATKSLNTNIAGFSE